MPSPPAPPPQPPPAPSPRPQFALIAAIGLAVVLLAFLCMRFQLFTADRNMTVPIAALLGWIAVGVGLFGLLFGARSSELLYRVLRIFFIVLIAFPGMFATVALATKRPDPTPDPTPAATAPVDPELAAPPRRSPESSP